jgi:hypothetical protein
MSDVRCQMSDVRCQMSDVRCQMSDVRCQMSIFKMSINQRGIMKKALLLSLPFAFLLNPLDAYAGKKHHRKQPKKHHLSSQPNTKSNTTPNATATTTVPPLQASIDKAPSPIIASPEPTTETAAADVKVTTTEGTVLGAPIGASTAVEADKKLSKSLPSSAKKDEDPLAPFKQSSGLIWGTVANLKFNWLSNSQVEMEKFMPLKLGDVLDLLEEGKGWSSCIGKAINYSTGSNEKAADNYNGYLILWDLNYGNVRHTYKNPQEGWDSNAALTSDREEIDAYNFLSEIAKEGREKSFVKGTPVKDDYSHTSIKYVLHNNDGTKEVTVTAIRLQKDEYERIMENWKSSQTSINPEEKLAD